MNDILNKKYDKKGRFRKKLLFQYLSKPLGIIDNIKYSYSQKDRNISSDPLQQLSLNFEEIEEIVNSKNKEIIKYLYFYRLMLYKVLYDNDKIINIDDSFGKITDISFHFFLCMIINYNQNVINYSFSINYIRQIHNLKENCYDKIYKKIILSKIILELIDNYKSSYDYFVNDIKDLNEIENKAKIDFRSINYLDINININEKKLISKKIEEIYIEIINTLIKNKKLEEENNKYDIINQLDLQNIILTNKMFQQLSLLLNSNDKFINDYIIINIDDIFDYKKVNFYYILFKYILKNAIYIHQNNFLNKARKTIIQIIYSKSDKLLNLRKDYKNSSITSDLKEKIIYLIKIFADSEYYYEKYINQNKDINTNSINIVSNKMRDENSNIEISQNSRNITEKLNIFEPKPLPFIYENMANYPDDAYQIIKIKDIIGKHLREAEFITETKNGECISGGDNNELYFYNKEHQLISRFSLENDDVYIKEDSIHEEEKEMGQGVKVKKWSISINELSYDEENKELSFCECSKFGFSKVYINFKTEETQKEDLSIRSCSISFKIGNAYIIAGEKGILQLQLSSKNRMKEKDSKKGTYRGGIKLSDKHIVLSSNSRLKKGEDKLYLYDIKEKEVKILCRNNYSFTISTNSLSIMDFDSYKIILCGCKQYNKNQKNGILLVNEKMAHEEFFDTEDFEVYCLCPISETKKEEDITILNPTNYFFAGGFDQGKNKGMIKLFKIIKEGKFQGIEYVQDIIFSSIPFSKNMDCLGQKNKSIFFNDFKRTISCIIQSKVTGEIFITSWDGFVYLFSPPNISYYLNEDKKEYNGIN